MSSSLTKTTSLELADLLQFVEFTNLFRKIERTILYAGVDSPERDGEHAFQIAITSWFVNRRLKLKLNDERIMLFAIVHDLPEIYAEDTPVFIDIDGVITGSTLSSRDKAERESIALERITREWGDRFPEMTESLQAYSDQSCEESRFVYAMDKLISTINIYQDEGRTWQLLHTSFEKLDAYKNGKCAAHPSVHELYLELRDLLQSNPHFFHSEE